MPQANAAMQQPYATMARYEDRVARALAHVVNMLDPDVIVIGGGLSRIQRLYANLPALLPPLVFGGSCNTPIVPAKHGDSSGVRGAAWLWSVNGAEANVILSEAKLLTSTVAPKASPNWVPHLRTLDRSGA